MLDPSNFREEISSNQMTLVVFGASWCMPCKMMEPLLKELSEKYRVMKIDAEESPVETSEYSISSVPTLIFFQNGNIIKKMAGQQPRANIVKAFEGE